MPDPLQIDELLAPGGGDPFAQHNESIRQIREAVTPVWSKPFAGMTPQQANKEAQILANPNVNAPGKIGPGYLSDSTRMGEAALDIGSLALPELKATAAFKGMAAAGKALRPAGFWKEDGEGFRKLAKLNDEGKTLSEMASELDVNEPMISREMSRRGIELKNRQKPGIKGHEDWNDRLKEMEDRGMSRAAMARELGVTPPAITHRFNAMRLRENPESAEGMGQQSITSEWEVLPDGTLSRVTKGEPLQRKVIERGRSGRPLQTEPLAIGNENTILEAGQKRAEESLFFHGSGQPYKAGRTDPLYLTELPEEAEQFAHGVHLGGEGNNPQVHALRVKPGKVKNIDAEIGSEMEEGGDVEEAIQRAIASEKAAGRDGARYLQFYHPSFGDREEFLATISIHPHEDVRYVNTNTLNNKYQPLQRNVIERGRSGRPTTTEPLSIGNENAILESGAAKSAPEPPGITAYHGSPYNFDKFDFSKRLTGEGANAYGAGGYFAENEGVAKSYRDALNNKQWNLRESARTPENEQMIDYINKAKSGASTPEEAIASLQRDAQAHSAKAQDVQNRSDMPSEWIHRQATYSQSQATELNNAADWLSSHKGDLSPGRMYQVAIKADPEHFLDWAKPLSEQSEHVQKALAAIPNARAAEFRQAIAQIEQEPVSPSQQQRLANLRAVFGSGSSIYDLLGREQASEALHKAGIPGIKYLDQGSRVDPADIAHLKDEIVIASKYDANSPKVVALKEKLAKMERPGTSNYVVFDDSMIDILKKYGIPGLISAGYFSHRDGDDGG
jgi:hypothetical protein